MKDKTSLVRITATSNGEFKLDTSGKAQGRGAYICPDTACLQKSLKSRGLERSLKREVPQEIHSQLCKYIESTTHTTHL
ncbi:MAG: YlxR family protein [Defluviitaleaceae bacterium]|nr:YlxR family protein [Defluviitaleaceae bacterium]